MTDLTEEQNKDLALLRHHSSQLWNVYMELCHDDQNIWNMQIVHKVLKIRELINKRIDAYHKIIRIAENGALYAIKDAQKELNINIFKEEELTI